MSQTTENWPRLHRATCCCRNCRRESELIESLAEASLSTALRHAQSRLESESGLEAATPKGPISLPATFSGWLGGVSVDVLLGPNPPAPYKDKSVTITGPGLLYRIDQKFKQRPLYIGMAYDSSIVARVASHLRRVVTKAGVLAKTKQATNLRAVTAKDFDEQRSEIDKLRILVAKLPQANELRVRYGKVERTGGYPMDPKLLHACEAALQVLEKPRSYVGSARTFEELVVKTTDSRNGTD